MSRNSARKLLKRTTVGHQKFSAFLYANSRQAPSKTSKQQQSSSSSSRPTTENKLN